MPHQGGEKRFPHLNKNKSPQEQFSPPDFQPKSATEAQTTESGKKGKGAKTKGKKVHHQAISPQEKGLKIPVAPIIKGDILTRTMSHWRERTKEKIKEKARTREKPSTRGRLAHRWHGRRTCMIRTGSREEK